MLSPGRYHESVPRDPAANLRFRVALLKAAAADRRLRPGLIEVCKRDFFFFVDVFCWQYNPRHPGREVGPFVTWPFQRAAARATIDRLFGDRRSILWEKSRELGATWLAVLLFVWMCLFHDWKKFLFVSHTEEAVKADDLDSLFGKVQFVLDHLPGWLRRGAGRRNKKLGFGFPATRSSITGAATTERAGVGGRNTAVLLDEFSKQRDDYKIWGQTADTGPRLVVGTHYGIAGCFFDLATADQGVPKLVMHWSEHPDKRPGLYRSGVGKKGWEPLDPGFAYPPGFAPVTDGRPTGGPFPGLRSPWYDAECRERNNARDVAMHLDIDPQGSTSQLFDAATIYRLRRGGDATACPALWEGDVDLAPAEAEVRTLVPRAGGPLRLWLLPDHRSRVPPGKYGAGCDIALGTGATPSVLAVGDAALAPARLMAEYVDANVQAPDFARLAVALCRLFRDADGNPALLCWEHAGPAGEQFAREVVATWRYTRVYFRADEQKLRPEQSDKPGWMPNQRGAKELLLKEFASALYAGRLAVTSDEMLAECLAFQFNDRGNKVFHGGEQAGDDPRNRTVNHGDRVIAGGLMWKMLDSLGARRAEKDRERKAQEFPYLSAGWLHQERDRRKRDAAQAWGRRGYLRR